MGEKRLQGAFRRLRKPRLPRPLMTADKRALSASRKSIVYQKALTGFSPHIFFALRIIMAARQPQLTRDRRARLLFDGASLSLSLQFPPAKKRSAVNLSYSLLRGSVSTWPPPAGSKQTLSAAHWGEMSRSARR